MRVVICGAGQVGFNLARYLSEHDNHVTVIDSSQELIQQINDRLDVKAVWGYASYPEVLHKAGAESADMIIAVTHSDEVNMIACEVAHALFNIPKKIARVRAQAYLHPQWARLFDQSNLSIDVVISPEVEVAHAISRSLTVPGAFNIIPLAEGKVKVVAVRCAAETPIVNTPVSHINSLFPELDLTVVGIVRGDQNFIPLSSDILHAGDEVYFAVDEDLLPLAMKAFGYDSADSRRLVILGGGNIGLCLAQEIERNHPNVRAEIIERNQARAEFISQQLSRTLVLNGDALDSEVLAEAGVNSAETVVAVTEDDRVNMLACLLVKRLGTKRAMTLINNSSYAPLITSLGVDAVLVPKKVTVSKILQYVRQQGILSVYSLGESFGEIIEAEATSASGLVGSSVEELTQPRKILVAALVREGEVLIPTPTTTIKLHDRVILMVNNTAIGEIEKLFAARLEYY